MDDLISRQAALNELHLLAIEALRKQRRDYCAIIDICSNKIKSLPVAVTTEVKKMDNDIISRQATIDFIKNHSYPVRYDGNSIEQGMTLTGIEQALKEIPSIQLEQKTATFYVDSEGYERCSACKEYESGMRYFNFCPNCGAKMGK